MDQQFSDKAGPRDPDQCDLKNLTEEEQKALQQMLDQLAGPSEEEFNQKFQELLKTVGEAANAGKDAEAQQAAVTMLMMAGARGFKEPGPDLQLTIEADDCESAGDWAGAETAYRKLLAMNEQSGNSALVAKSQLDLSRLLRLVGRADAAWSYACAATESARRADTFPLTVMMLENEVRCALDRGDVPRALAAAAEAVPLVQPGRMHNSMRLQTLTMRAHCLLASGDLEEAERDLKAGAELESDLAMPNMSGPITNRARRWEVQAELEIRQGNLTKAADSLSRAVELRRRHADGNCCLSPYALVALARGLEQFADVSERIGNSVTAQDASTQAKSLRERAHVPPMPAPPPG